MFNHFVVGMQSNRILKFNPYTGKIKLFLVIMDVEKIVIRVQWENLTKPFKTYVK